MQLTRQDLINEIEYYKKRIVVIQTELENFLKYLDQVVFKKTFLFCSPGKANVSSAFHRAFSTLSDHEKTDYYLVCLKIIHSINTNETETQPQLGHERVELEYREGGKNWKKTTVIMSYKQVMLEVEALKLKLKLENYIFRMSKAKEKAAFVLESTRVDAEPMTLRLGHNSKQALMQILMKMKGLAMAGLKKKIIKMMVSARDSASSSETCFQKREYFPLEASKTTPDQRTSLRLMLKERKSIDNQLSSKQQSKQKILKQIQNLKLIESLDDLQQYELFEGGFFIHKHQKRLKKIHTFKPNAFSLEWIVKELMRHENFRLWKKSLCSISLIGDVPQEQTKFYHQINVYRDGYEIDYVYMRCQFEIQGVVYFIDKSVATAEYGSHETSTSRGKIQFCLWRIKENQDKSIQVVAQIEISHLSCPDIYQAMSQQIGQLQNIALCKNPQQKIKRSSPKPIAVSFFSIKEEGSFSEKQNDVSQEDSYVSIMEKSFQNQNEEQSCFYSILNIQDEDPSEDCIKESEQNLLNLAISPIKPRNPIKKIYAYQVRPTHKGAQMLFKQYKNDKFFDYNECVPNDIGDLVFTNQEKIKAQGGVLVGVLKRLGANIISGKSILNVSLPIEIFSADTNIERLCKGMAYAPHFLENKVNSSPLQRIKAAVCFSLGTLILYIDMAKPFNPILGETYQAFIDGCPIYGQQTSHHPPISSLLMVGRQYFVSANLEAKVDIGMNSASGTNYGEYHIAFHPTDPTKNQVIFTSPAGELSGMIYGERKLNLINKSRYYDPQNNIFCEIRWGKGKSKHHLSKFHDFFEGKIVRLSKTFPNISKIKESDKDQVLGVINGRWTQTVYFNDQPIFQINKLRPFQVTEEKVPLKSDSRLRQDRNLLGEGNLPDAQIAKEKLEEIQRRDRKLRKH